MISQMQELTTNWQGKQLSLAGRLILVKTVLTDLLAFIFHMSQVLVAVSNILEMCNFYGRPINNPLGCLEKGMSIVGGRLVPQKSRCR